MSNFHDPKALEILARARATNRHRDKLDRKNGFAAPSDCPVDVALGTAMGAIYAGLSSSDWNCIAEGYAMLEDVATMLETDGVNRQ